MPDPTTISEVSPQSLEMLNSPIAVVAILSVILGFLGMFIREFSWWVKSMKKNTPSDKIEQSNRDLGNTMVEIGTNLKLLNQEMKHHVEMSSKTSEILLHEIREVKNKL